MALLKFMVRMVMTCETYELIGSKVLFENRCCSLSEGSLVLSKGRDELFGLFSNHSNKSILFAKV